MMSPASLVPLWAAIQSLSHVKNHVAPAKPVRLTATVWDSLLQLYIQINRKAIEIRHKDGEMMMTVTAAEASLLAMRGFVAGHVNRDCLKYLIARVPKSRILHVLARTAPRSSQDITIKKTYGLGWAARYDQAKLGYCGGRSAITHTPSESIMRCVGGDCTRRAVSV
jgi:hypothetical protein